MRSKPDLYLRIVLTAIAVFLGVLAARPAIQPDKVAAAGPTVASYESFYVEPGTVAIRKPDGSQMVEGKLMVDMRTGDIWGFPTRNALPYPVDPAHSQPPVSEPIYMGRFDLARTQRFPRP